MARHLPSAEWTLRGDLAALVEALGEGQLRWVGGAVRDTLLGLPVADIDAATPLLPEEVMDRLKHDGIRCIPTGIDHGTVTALLPGGNVEITTLRQDVATDGRHAVVSFAKDWRADAARRDFTINALFAEPGTLLIHDYFGGLGDLAAGRVRFIGEAVERIREDHLRILRYFRFQCRFGAALDAEAEAACAELGPLLAKLSAERVAMEVLNLLALPDPTATVTRMLENDVWKVVLPETGPSELTCLASLVANERRAGMPADPLRRLAALLPANAEMARQAAQRLRLSNRQQDRLACAAGRGTGAEAGTRSRELAYRLGMICAQDRMLIDGHSLAPLENWTVPALPVSGKDIIARGISPGPQISDILKKVESHWVADNFPGEQRVRELLNRVLAEE
ncbi:CCA tRNA nucleotidyltransferase [Altererythrobacter sp. SALINAS58]|uniref:CCA tRNA nucleotidyltransferase n=1 Tax=Alteripontixanthobacter muriae TaxID=2705546 RepID=UPI0015776A3D|nr:CCA tRNA nucleotidyltransferase [Alteripontixanthobacter muriae]NTZ42000.1 CCA tRNA nucleotidyltransferase [Alteripontixanthobacter muriae]